MDLRKINKFSLSLRLSAIFVLSLFMVTGFARKTMAANGLNEVANGNTVTATTIGGAGATVTNGLIESNETASTNIIIDSNTGVVTIGNNIIQRDSFTLTESSGSTTQTINVNTSGTNNGVVFADDLVVSSTAFTNSLTVTGVNDNITFEGNATTSGGGTNSIAIVGGTGTSTLSLTFDTANVENIIFDASITASNTLDTITMNVNNSQGGANTITFSQKIGATAALDILNIGLNTTATFNGTVDADAVNISNTNTTTFNGTVTGAIDFALNGTISAADGVNFTGAITNTTTNEGTLNVAGTSTFSGDVGSTIAGLNAVNIQGSGKTATFAGDLKATTTTISNLATLKFTKAATSVTGAITSSGTGILEVGTADVTVSGAVTLGSTATLNITIGTDNGSIIGTAGVSLASGTTLVPTIVGTITSGQAITIIQSTGAVTIPTITDNNLRLDFVAAQSSNDLTLTATTLSSSALGLTGTTAEINDIVDTAFSGDTLLDELNGLSSNAELDTALETLAPTVDGGAIVGSVTAGTASRQVVQTRMANLRVGIGAGQGLASGDEYEGQRNFWTQGFGSFASGRA